MSVRRLTLTSPTPRVTSRSKLNSGNFVPVTLMPTRLRLPKLSGRQSDRLIDIIIANMERWRWLPHDLGKTYVIVNLPDFTLRVMRQGKQVWMTRIVVGKP